MLLQQCNGGNNKKKWREEGVSSKGISVGRVVGRRKGKEAVEGGEEGKWEKIVRNV